MSILRTTPDLQQHTSLFQSIVLIIAACIVHGVMQGVHDNYGIMMTGLIPCTGIDYVSISFCIGVGALVYGFAQPFLGILALRKSHSFVIMVGIVCTVIGLVATPFCTNTLTLLFFFGLLLPFGTTGLCFGIIMGAITPILGEKRAAVVSGLVQASAGIGDALMSPALNLAISRFDIAVAMQALTVPFLLMIPIGIWMHSLRKGLSGNEKEGSEEAVSKNVSLIPMLRFALKDRDYRLIVIGFGTCGFNMSIIESHLFSQYLSYGIDGSTASLTLTVYGIATMIGAAGTGFLGAVFKMKNVLGCVYAIRVVISLAFLFLPKSVAFAFAATALLGLSGDATVPPTSGIISKKFGSQNMAVLYGFTLIGHQVGAFFSAYLGGFFVDIGVGYGPLWLVNLCLAAIASTASFRIRNENERIEYKGEF
ncbi:MFS transporter [Megasphaera sp. D52t1_170925_H4]|uniref:MFS transporter n=1 Tax=Megasphaera sp. D52t1_170925_H4 TaxID=2787095 RepID=UPI00189C3CDB|nr:MFS transporter [Megasphaera sp. D52t1_170925_H4]